MSVDQRLPEEPALEEEQQQLEKKLPGEPGQTGIFGGLFPEGRNVVFSRAVWDRSEAQPGHCWVLLIPVPDPRAWWHWRWGEPSGSPHRQPFAAQAKKNSCCLHLLAWLRCSVNSHRCLFPWSLCNSVGLNTDSSSSRKRTKGRGNWQLERGTSWKRQKFSRFSSSWATWSVPGLASQKCPCWPYKGEESGNGTQRVGKGTEGAGKNHLDGGAEE